MLNDNSIVWMDGQFMPHKESKIDWLSHSLHYGCAVFEGIRAYNGAAFKLNEHIKRLLDSLEVVDMQIKYSLEDLSTAVNEVIARNGLKDCYIRPIVWFGSKTLGVASLNCDIHTAIAAWDWPAYYPSSIKLGLSKWRRPSGDCGVVQAKVSGLYVIASLTKNAAIRQGFDDAIMLDYRGYVAECSSANIFFVFNGELHTPTPDCFLNGITRQTVIELAQKAGIKVIERHIELAEIESADEVFVTGTAAEITPVVQIQEKLLNIGKITLALQDLYANLKDNT
jgi:branched-chain amino acid aminotransferase